MGILKKITGHKDEDEVQESAPVCPHTSLKQTWRNPEDFGNAEMATYTCESCAETVSYQEAMRILDPSKHTPNLPIG
jgi:hypothetical protein